MGDTEADALVGRLAVGADAPLRREILRAMLLKQQSTQMRREGSKLYKPPTSIAMRTHKERSKQRNNLNMTCDSMWQCNSWQKVRYWKARSNNNNKRQQQETATRHNKVDTEMKREEPSTLRLLFHHWEQRVIPVGRRWEQSPFC